MPMICFQSTFADETIKKFNQWEKAVPKGPNGEEMERYIGQTGIQAVVISGNTCYFVAWCYYEDHPKQIYPSMDVVYTAEATPLKEIAAP